MLQTTPCNQINALADQVQTMLTLENKHYKHTICWMCVQYGSARSNNYTFLMFACWCQQQMCDLWRLRFLRSTTMMRLAINTTYMFSASVFWCKQNICEVLKVIRDEHQRIVVATQPKKCEQQNRTYTKIVNSKIAHIPKMHRRNDGKNVLKVITCKAKRIKY